MVAHDAAELRHPGKIVLLHVEGTGHPVRIGEARRIEDHQVVLRTLRHSLVDEGQCIGDDHREAGFVDEAVGRQIALCNGAVRVGHVHAGHGFRLARRGIHGEASRIREEVEDPQPLADAPDVFARDGMVQEETGVDMAGEVHQELQPMLLDDELHLLVAHEGVLLQPLPLAPDLVDDASEFDIRHPVDQVDDLGLRGFVQGSWCVVDDLGVLAVQVDGHRHALEVAVVYPHGLAVRAAHPATALEGPPLQEFCKILSFIIKHGLLILEEIAVLG